MKWPLNLYSKWIPWPHKLEAEVGLTNDILIVMETPHLVLGFTIFNSADPMNTVERLKRRLQQGLNGCSLIRVYCPSHAAKIFKSYQPICPVELQVHETPIVYISNHLNQMKIRDKVRLANVDDSPLILKFLKKTLSKVDWIEVTDQISDSTKAVDVLTKNPPDVLTLDIQMPIKNGIDVLTDLLDHKYLPVIMVSSLSIEDGPQVMEALQKGAFDYVQKPEFAQRAGFAAELSQRVLQAVDGRMAHSALHYSKPKKKPFSGLNFSENTLWAIGSSTGGTQALTRIFTSLPNGIPPTLIVQHIPPLFSEAFARTLNSLCPFVVREAKDGDELTANHVYIAPGGMQMAVSESGGKLKIRITDDEPVNRFKPSVDYLFNALADLKSPQIVAGILTGMGRDGADGLLKLKQNNAKTFAQDQESSAVWGMPRVAAEIGAAMDILPLDQIDAFLIESSSKFKKAV